MVIPPLAGGTGQIQEGAQLGAAPGRRAACVPRQPAMSIVVEAFDSKVRFASEWPSGSESRKMKLKAAGHVGGSPPGQGKT